jgi:hypothetical protein
VCQSEATKVKKIKLAILEYQEERQAKPCEGFAIGSTENSEPASRCRLSSKI